MADWPDHFTRDMSCTRSEWQRLLAQALGGPACAPAEGAEARIPLDGGTLTLRWQEGPPRQIALMRLATLRLHFAFDGVTPAARQAFMRHLDLHTHRGGG